MVTGCDFPATLASRTFGLSDLPDQQRSRPPRGVQRYRNVRPRPLGTNWPVKSAMGRDLPAATWPEFSSPGRGGANSISRGLPDEIEISLTLPGLGGAISSALSEFCPDYRRLWTTSCWEMGGGLDLVHSAAVSDPDKNNLHISSHRY